MHQGERLPGQSTRQRGPLAARATLGLAILTLLLAGLARLEAAPQATAASQGMSDPALARSDYIENCGGCHGITGSSAPAQVPELRGRVGYFMCTEETRAYILRLPNVAHSRIVDDGQLAELMNYVVYVLGKDSVPAGRAPFTGPEVARERRQALSAANLTDERARNVAIAMRECGAPATLGAMYDPR